MKPWLIVSALYGITAVILGALGAHALKGELTPDSLDAFKTATQYQLIHGVALAAAAFAIGQGMTVLRPVAVLWSLGVLLFSCSIYLLTCHAQLGLPKWRFLGPVTPLGGLLMMLGWAWLLVCAIRLPSGPK
jgi:uncharacterized membrane protein YgdD (TMEM256/DUF423 family)